MATRNESQPYDTATANFKLWSGFIRHLFLTDGGWTQSADSGQTNPTTVGTAPTNGNYVYEIYCASDALSATKPMYVKVEYGQKNSVPSVAMTLGTGSNGSGTITGGGTRFANSNISGAGGTLGGTGYDCVGSADAGSIRFLMWRQHPTSTVPCFFALERAKDSTGAAIGDFQTLFVYGYNIDGAAFGTAQDFRQQTILSTGAAGNVEGCWLTFQTALTSAGLGANDAHVPLFHMPGYLACASLDLLCSKGADLAEASSNTISHYGSNHTYYFTKVGGATGFPYIGNVTTFPTAGNTAVLTANNGLAFRYE